MADRDARALEEARTIAAEMFRVDVKHLTEAPIHCSQSETDGGCSDGETCDIVAGAEAIAVALTAQREAGRREGREEAAKAIGHTIHAAGCQFHAYEANVGRTCPDAAHVKPCAHCEERTAAIRAGAAETSYDPAFGDDRACLCGHPYYRHFDSYDSMRPIGCKYCDCGAWSAPKAGA